jgi:hypothetical protein
MKNADLYGINLFNEKATRIEQLSFSKWLSSTDIQVIIEKNDDDSLTTKSDFIDLEAIEAFALTFRFFMQNNESSSFGRLSETFKKIEIASDIQTRYEEIRKRLNAFLDSKSIANAPNFIAYREVVDIVLYGNLAHANKTRKSEYDLIAKYPHNDAILKFSFFFAARKIIEIIKEVKALNVDIIHAINAKSV